MGRKGIIAISLGMNLVLAVAVSQALRWSAPLAAPITSGKSLINLVPPVGASPPVGETITTNRFLWSQLKSSDLEQYLTNLRAIGCPERTVRDIISREIQRSYSRRSLRNLEPKNFWACGPEREQFSAPYRQALILLHQEERELNRRLLGVECVVRNSDFDEVAGRAIFLFITGVTRSDALDRVIEIFKGAEAARNDLQEGAGNLRTPAFDAEMERHRKRAFEELSAALSPAELEELGLRFSALKMMDRNVENFKCTAAELRVMAGAYYQTLGFGGGLDFEQFIQSRDLPVDKQDELDVRLKQSLGPQRYDDWQRGTDHDYQALTEFVSGAKLPANIAPTLFDVRRLAQREHERVVADVLAGEAARRDRLREIRQTTLEAIRTQLGEAVYLEYSQRGLASWIEELGRP